MTNQKKQTQKKLQEEYESTSKLSLIKQQWGFLQIPSRQSYTLIYAAPSGEVAVLLSVYFLFQLRQQSHPICSNNG